MKKIELIGKGVKRKYKAWKDWKRGNKGWTRRSFGEQLAYKRGKTEKMKIKQEKRNKDRKNNVKIGI